MSRTAPHFRYDPHLGDPRAEYSRADAGRSGGGRPEVPGVFIAQVDGETVMNTMHGRQSVAWQAHPGTPCLILGYWSDGTVHLRWAAINDAYQVDGRFPAWVVERDHDARMAGGGRLLRASSPPEPRRGLSPRVVNIVVLVLTALALVVVLVVLRDAIVGLPLTAP